EVGDKLGFHPVGFRYNMFGKMDCFSFYLIDIHGRMEHVKTSCDLFSMIFLGTFIILKNRRFLSVFSPISPVIKGFLYPHIHIILLRKILSRFFTETQISIDFHYLTQSESMEFHLQIVYG